MLKLPAGVVVVNVEQGLANRLLGLEAAILLGNATGKRVLVNWPLVPELNCRYEELLRESEHFELIDLGGSLSRGCPPGISRRIVRLLRPFGLHARAGRFLDWVYRRFVWRIRYRFDIVIPPHGGTLPDLPVLARKKRVLSMMCDRYFPSMYTLDEGYDYVRLTEELERRVDEVVSGFTGRMVGVHVRCGKDRQRHFTAALSKAYLRAMEKELAADEGVRFYVATDSHDEHARLRREFGDRIVSQPRLKLGRGGVEEMKCGVVDLFALAATQKVLWGGYSSFAALAIRMGQTQHRIVRA